MKKALFATAALVFVFATPALAQSYGADIGSGSALYASNRNSPIHSHQTTRGHHRTVRRVDPSEAYGTPAIGPRWPGAHYDAYGYYIDPNDPDLW
jgi:hypothetical protein